MLMLLLAALSTGQAGNDQAILLNVCQLIASPDRYFGKTVQVTFLWETAGSRNVLRAVDSDCREEKAKKPYWETEFIPIYPESTEASASSRDAKKLMELAREVSGYRSRTLTTIVLIKGEVVNFRTSSQARRGDAEYGHLGTWPYGIKIIKALEH